jgi:hypothetical protein
LEEYQKPVVQDYGDLTELTAEQITGNVTDVPLGTVGFAILTCDPTVPVIPCVTV